MLVATSAEPLANLATEGRFDAGLLSQLSAGAVVLPPLRSRRDDIPALIERFWRAAGAEERAAPLLASLSPAALTILSNAYWPGNLDHLPAWWLHTLLHTPHPLKEKLTLFWHGHFATSAAKVSDASS